MSLIALSLFSFSAYAQNFCVTHAQCQNLTDESTACFLVKTNENSQEKPTCETKCFRVFVGSYCKFEEGQNFGSCAEEDYKTPSHNTEKPDCSKAIPSEVLADVFPL